MNPEQFAKASESSQQIALFMWAAKELKEGRHPELRLLVHIPNGGTRGESERSREIAGGRLKAEGVKPGIPDVGLFVSRHGLHGLWVEMKRPSLKSPKDPLNGCSEKQLKWIEALRSEGYGVMIAYSWLEARDGILEYLKGE